MLFCCPVHLGVIRACSSGCTKWNIFVLEKQFFFSNVVYGIQHTLSTFQSIISNGGGCMHPNICLRQMLPYIRSFFVKLNTLMPSAKSRLILIYTVVEQSLMVVYQTLFFFLRLILTAFFFVAVFSSKWFTAVLIKSACFQYRSINHRVDAGSLRLYRWYYSRICQWWVCTFHQLWLIFKLV